MNKNNKKENLTYDEKLKVQGNGYSMDIPDGFTIKKNAEEKRKKEEELRKRIEENEKRINEELRKRIEENEKLKKHEEPENPDKTNKKTKQKKRNDDFIGLTKAQIEIRKLGDEILKILFSRKEDMTLSEITEAAGIKLYSKTAKALDYLVEQGDVRHFERERKCYYTAN